MSIATSDVDKLGQFARPPARDLEFLSEGGEMGARMRALDWSATPLGSPAHWPQSLKTIVRVMLDSRYAMWMLWGPELTFSYSPVYDDESRITGVLCVVTEVTDRVVGERRLRILKDLAAGAIGAISVEECCERACAVLEEDGGLASGNAVNFLLIDRRVRFESSLTAAERAGLRISSQLLCVAVRVQTGFQWPLAACGPASTAGQTVSGCQRLAMP